MVKINVPINSCKKSVIQNVAIKLFKGDVVPNPEDGWWEHYANVGAVFSIEHFTKNTDNTTNDNTLKIVLRKLAENKNYDGSFNILFFNKLNCKEKIVYNITNFKDINPNFHEITTKTFYITLPFKIIVANPETEDYNEEEIPRIIHQSYKLNTIKYNNFIACSSWWFLNMNYEYKYWSDKDIVLFLKTKFPERVWDAYNTVYAGACKSDIFRLCILYVYGGVWSDISASCEVSLDCVLRQIDKKTNTVLCKDTPSQITNPNIYQAFLITKPNNELIKFVLDFTVERVIQNKKYDKMYPWLVGEGIGITGPSVFAIAFNLFYKRNPREFITEGEYKNSPNGIQTIMINHPGKIITIDNKKIITTKYNNFQEDRTNLHYQTLLSQGYVFKKEIENVFVNSENNDESNNVPTMYQTWIQGKHCTEKMFRAVNTWKINHPKMNYSLITNDIMLKMLENDEVVPGLRTAYKKIQPYAFKSDIIRIYVLYITGGIYSDIDSISFYPSTENFKKYDLVFVNDIDTKYLCNCFMSSKNPKHPFFKFVLKRMVDNILQYETRNYKSDLEITGPHLLASCFTEFFKIPLPFNPKIITTSNGEKIKILRYTFNLPPPQGSWRLDARDFKITEGNLLTANIRNNRGKIVLNKIRFLPKDNIISNNGVLVGNSNFVYKQTEGAVYIYDDENKRIIANSKYPGYNEERIIMEGNDFAKMFAMGYVVS